MTVVSLLRCFAALCLLAAAVQFAEANHLSAACAAAETIHPDAACAAAETDSDTTLYYLLGMLEDYAGRHMIEGDSLVERFYPYEAPTAFIFGERLEELRLSRAIVDTISYAPLRQGDSVFPRFYSRELRALIDSCFVVDRSRSFGAVERGTGRSARRLFARALKSALVDSASIEEKLAYVEGAYLRQGLKGCIVDSAPRKTMNFANTVYKRDLVERFLRDLGCTDIEVVADREGIPVCSELYFAPSDLVRFMAIDEAIRACRRASSKLAADARAPQPR